MTYSTAMICVSCGPLLDYKSIDYDGENPIWHGTVLIVAQPSNLQSFLELKCLGDVSSYGASSLSGENFLSEDSACGLRTIQGVKLYQDPSKAFWRFQITLPLQVFEARWQYAIPNIQFLTDVAKYSGRVFVVPTTHQSVRFMFHSCNGFSVGTYEDFWSGPALWQDVLKIHQKRPFHVMIGGGDQIYSDKVMATGPLKSWTDITNPKKRRDFPFSEQTKADCDRFYYDTYVKWYFKERFASANSQIPQINIWDDHDIIDGFGSYVDMFMRCAVFRGIGGIAFKYYRLFQHHAAPPPSPHSPQMQRPQSVH